jgi:hypothetical protein
MPKQIQQTQHHPERDQPNHAPRPDEAPVVGGQEPSRPITARPKLAEQGITRLQRQLGNRAVGALLRIPKRGWRANQPAHPATTRANQCLLG